MLATVASFIIECYLAKRPSAVEGALARARHAAEVADGISYLRTTYIPGDETCLHLFEAPSSGVLSEAVRLAALGDVRIVEAIERTAPSREEK
jgi:uncharacterized protein YchJ